MAKLLQLITENPRAFDRSMIPCALLGPWEAAILALEDRRAA